MGSNYQRMILIFVSLGLLWDVTNEFEPFLECWYIKQNDAFSLFKNIKHKQKLLTIATPSPRWWFARRNLVKELVEPVVTHINQQVRMFLSNCIIEELSFSHFHLVIVLIGLVHCQIIYLQVLALLLQTRQSGWHNIIIRLDCEQSWFLVNANASLLKLNSHDFSFLFIHSTNNLLWELSWWWSIISAVTSFCERTCTASFLPFIRIQNFLLTFIENFIQINFLNLWFLLPSLVHDLSGFFYFKNVFHFLWRCSISILRRLRDVIFDLAIRILRAFISNWLVLVS